MDIVITFEDGKKIMVAKGSLLIEVLRRLSKPVQADCGGLGTCGKCIVLVDNEPVKACKYTVERDIKVKLLPEGYDGYKSIEGRKLDSHANHEESFRCACKETSKETSLALAVDLGTTTIAGYLLDRGTHVILSQASIANPQISIGADVVSRCAYAQEHGRATLGRPVRAAVDELLGKLVREAGVSRNRVQSIVMVGNSAMHHLFLELPTEGLTTYPYEPVMTDSTYVKAKDYGIEADEWTSLEWLPLIGGFVGADTVACMLSADMDEGIVLLIDIGTNGEIVLSDRGTLYACSTAAGPAFEGSHIECGMRGAHGAIDHVDRGNKSMPYRAKSDERISFSVIDNSSAKGICGSGLIDAVACLLEIGAVTPDGRLEEDFYFTDEVKLTQKDIRELQLAKGAVCSGLKTMLGTRKILPSQIDRLYLAGAFGNYLDVGRACDIGLLPRDVKERTAAIGNAAGLGACRAALDRSLLRVCEEKARSTSHLNLASDEAFGGVFLSSLDFVPYS